MSKNVITTSGARRANSLEEIEDILSKNIGRSVSIATGTQLEINGISVPIRTIFNFPIVDFNSRIWAWGLQPDTWFYSLLVRDEYGTYTAHLLS